MPGSFIGSLWDGASRSLALLRRLARRDGAGDPQPADELGAAPASSVDSRAARDPFGPSQGPPADWLERVRKGAPHLLLPTEPMSVDRGAPTRDGGPIGRPAAASAGIASISEDSLSAQAAAVAPNGAAADQPHPGLGERLRAAARAFAHPRSEHDSDDRGRERAEGAHRPTAAPDERPASSERRSIAPAPTVPAPPQAAGMGFRLHPIEGNADRPAPRAVAPDAGRPAPSPELRSSPMPLAAPQSRDDAAPASRNQLGQPDVGRSAQVVGDRADDARSPDHKGAGGWPKLVEHVPASRSADGPPQEPGTSPWPGLPDAHEDQPAGYRFRFGRDGGLAGSSDEATFDEPPFDEHGIWPTLPPRADGQDGLVAVIAAELDAERRAAAERVATLRLEQESWA